MQLIFTKETEGLDDAMYTIASCLRNPALVKQVISKKTFYLYVLKKIEEKIKESASLIQLLRVLRQLLLNSESIKTLDGYHPMKKLSDLLTQIVKSNVDNTEITVLAIHCLTNIEGKQILKLFDTSKLL